MNRQLFLCVAAAYLAFAGAASAETAQARQIRISTANKAAAEVKAEIKVAAKTVCEGLGGDCAERASLNAHRQFARLQRVNTAAPKPAARPTTIRIALAGKSQAQVRAEIRAAAQEVCANTNAGVGGLQACVSRAVADATQQLHGLRPAAIEQTASLY